MKSIYSEASLRLSKWLRQQRQAKGLTMRDAAKLIGKPHSFVGKIEVGQRRMDIIEYVWYCDKLGINAFEGLSFLVNSASSYVGSANATNITKNKEETNPKC